MVQAIHIYTTGHPINPIIGNGNVGGKKKLFSYVEANVSRLPRCFQEKEVDNLCPVIRSHDALELSPSITKGN